MSRIPLTWLSLANCVQLLPAHFTCKLLKLQASLSLTFWDSKCLLCRLFELNLNMHGVRSGMVLFFIQKNFQPLPPAMSSLNTIPVLQSIRWVMAKKKMQLRHIKKSDNARTNSVINPACFTWLTKNPNQRLRRVSLLKGCVVDAPDSVPTSRELLKAQVIQRCQREDAGKEKSPDTLLILQPKMRASRSNWCLCYVIASFGNQVSLQIDCWILFDLLKQPALTSKRWAGIITCSTAFGNVDFLNKPGTSNVLPTQQRSEAPLK